ncbi:hypothetical protein TrispH2_011191 [Trichoplax sp. H2]|nr:hypothetical protein TrispH2_011191 [Trichoplax sp. H2]|eukprot:RDD36478.1 hypothetical protein TrispH2_011191 [Trichoplax sp. H2]
MAADKKPFLFSRLQAPIQSFLRPAIWVPGLRNVHTVKEEWTIEASPGDAFDKAIEAIEEVKKQEEFVQVHMINKDSREIRLFYFTSKAQWLDIMELHFKRGLDDETAIVDARSFSSGLLPVCIPLSFVLNTVFFFFPFLDHDFNSKRLSAFRQAMGVGITLNSQCRGY